MKIVYDSARGHCDECDENMAELVVFKPGIRVCLNCMVRAMRLLVPDLPKKQPKFSQETPMMRYGVMDR
jgi:hypothetical protein